MRVQFERFVYSCVENGAKKDIYPYRMDFGNSDETQAMDYGCVENGVKMP